MAEQPIIFGNAQESGEAQLAGASPVALNVLVDGKGTVRRRPGLATYSPAPAAALDSSGIIGLHVTQGDVLLAVDGDRHIWRVKNGAALDLSTDITSPVRVSGAARPTFAENEVAVLIAGGSNIQKIDLETLASTLLSATSTDLPPHATHVVAHNQRFLANDLTSTATQGLMRYSKTGQVDYDEWPGRYILTAEARPDSVRAIGENINEVWAWGATTTQLWVPDPTSVYAPSKTMPRGIGAAYSVIDTGGSFAWLDNRKRFVLSDGRSQTEISAPIAKTLDAITAFDDCFGYRVALDQFDCLAWTFPRDGRTFVYQLGGGWSQWSGRQGSNLITFPVTAHHHRDSDGVDIVGLADGRVCRLTASAHTDLGDPIVAEVTTGYLNRGTDALKQCVSVRLTLQRGTTTSTSEEPVGFLTWRDDGGDFEDPIPVEMGLSGDTHVTLEFRSLGVYRRRQWKLTFSGSEEWVLASASEEFTVGGA